MKTSYSSANLFQPLILLLLFVSACQPAGPSATTTAPNDSTPTSEVKPVEVELVLGTGPLYLTDTRQGLDELSSFTASLIVSFTGSEGGADKGMDTLLRASTNKRATRPLVDHGKQPRII